MIISPILPQHLSHCPKCRWLVTLLSHGLLQSSSTDNLFLFLAQKGLVKRVSQLSHSKYHKMNHRFTPAHYRNGTHIFNIALYPSMNSIVCSYLGINRRKHAGYPSYSGRNIYRGDERQKGCTISWSAGNNLKKSSQICTGLHLDDIWSGRHTKAIYW